MGQIMLVFEANTNENTVLLNCFDKDGWIYILGQGYTILCLRMIFHESCAPQRELRQNQRNDETTIVQEVPDTYN